MKRPPFELNQAVLGGIHYETQLHAEKIWDAILAGDADAAGGRRHLAVRSGRWWIVRTERDFWLVRAEWGLTDGTEFTRNWRVPRTARTKGRECLYLDVRSNVLFTQTPRTGTLTGARAGSGRRLRGSGDRRSRSRPELGWSRANRRRNVG